MPTRSRQRSPYPTRNAPNSRVPRPSSRASPCSGTRANAVVGPCHPPTASAAPNATPASNTKSDPSPRLRGEPGRGATGSPILQPHSTPGRRERAERHARIEYETQGAMASLLSVAMPPDARQHRSNAGAAKVSRSAQRECLDSEVGSGYPSRRLAFGVTAPCHQDRPPILVLRGGSTRAPRSQRSRWHATWPSWCHPAPETILT